MTLLQWYAMVEMEYNRISGEPLPLDVAYQAYIAQTYLSGDKTVGDVAQIILTTFILSHFMG